MTLGSLAKAFNAQNVKLSISGSEVITIFNVTKLKDHPINRINSRAGAADFPSNPLIEVTFDAIVSKDVYTTFDTAATLSSRGVLPLTPFTVVGQNIGGVAGDDITITFSAIVPHMEDLAPERGAYTIRVTLRIANSTYVVS